MLVAVADREEGGDHRGPVSLSFLTKNKKKTATFEALLMTKSRDILQKFTSNVNSI